MLKEQASPEKQTPRDFSSQHAIAEQDSRRLRDLIMGKIGTHPHLSEGRLPGWIPNGPESGSGLRKEKHIGSRDLRLSGSLDRMDLERAHDDPSHQRNNGEQSASLKLNHSVGGQRNSSPVTPFLGF